MITPESATITATIEYFTFCLAAVASFSSPPAKRYWKPEIMKAISAITPNISNNVEANPARISINGLSESPPVAFDVGTHTPAILVKSPEGHAPVLPPAAPVPTPAPPPDVPLLTQFGVLDRSEHVPIFVSSPSLVGSSALQVPPAAVHAAETVTLPTSVPDELVVVEVVPVLPVPVLEDAVPLLLPEVEEVVVVLLDVIGGPKQVPDPLDATHEPPSTYP